MWPFVTLCCIFADSFSTTWGTRSHFIVFQSLLWRKLCEHWLRPRTQRHKCADSLLSPAAQCNVPCGNGTQRRDIICVQKNGNDFSVAPASKCAHLDKPAAVQACEMDECRPQWFTTEWSAVSGPSAAAHRERNAVGSFLRRCIFHGGLAQSLAAAFPGPRSARAPAERACK